ncbi:ParB-like nuclease domain protein [Rhodovulum sp. P5]|uniref:hypothetical protein n=1 Tax=Rhodovulum sp. P5 TaxID=1564506 RepID=UPI0009C39B8E|nr:hypothetical protein [Rhodovulum sp. P5]ARE38250.1 ParB-like nuclease domain protein [Rhodovulum sp. P5]
MTARLVEPYTLLDPAGIEDGPRLRTVSDAGVEAIRASYAELGHIKDPIDVRRKRGGKLVLMAGGHRLAFARAEGLQVPAKIWVCNDDFARVMEIDDNLAGSELTPLHTAVFLAERKRIYEKMHPETRAQVAGGLGRQGLAAELGSFADVTAEKLGSRRGRCARSWPPGRR